MSVTPISRGLIGPSVTSLVVIAAIWASAATWTWADQNAAALSIVLVGPCGVVLGGRLWRWRSHKIVVTNQRIIQYGGVARRHSSGIDLIDVTVTRTDQRWFERLTRRGAVIVETPAGSFVLERVRRPDSLARVIDHQRVQLRRVDEIRLDRAQELSDALAAGLLSNDEYDRRWRHLFGPESPRR